MSTKTKAYLRLGSCILGGLILIVALLPGCTGAVAQTGTISGKVTNGLTGAPLSGVAIVPDPPVPGVTITTDSSGSFSAKLPAGSYKLSYKKDNFVTSNQTVQLNGQATTAEIVLKPAKPVVFSAGAAQNAAPGAAVTLKATADILDGSTVTGYKWEQTAGPKAAIDNPAAESIRVTLANAATYKTQLLEGLELLDRFVVQAINPHALAAAETATFKVTMTTSKGTYTSTVNVVAGLPYIVNTGLANVAKGEPVLLHGKEQSAYKWSLVAPAGSKAALDSEADPNPSFTPDVVGKYTVTEKNSGATIDVYAGTWSGGITGQDAKGKPVSAGCAACHNGTVAPDNFKDWSQSGHATIFTENINTSTHYSESCLACHSVGFDEVSGNGGITEAADYADFIKSDMLHNTAPNNWTEILAKYPKTAKLANIQCENCHGPNDGSTLHGNKEFDAARVSISSDVCGACHGEPPRHGRYQQWEESGHGNFELAIDESGSANCARCHTGQGFMAWLAQGDLTKQLQGAKGNATADEMKAIVTRDNAQPQTCVVCHDPHKLGDTSGVNNNVILRVQGDTAMLPSGYKATNVGNGALCITCHNTRNGMRNDSVNVTAYQAPHAAAQGDVLMGQNAYFVSVGQRSPHAAVENTCTTCHMELSPAPAEFSLPGNGTNHDFKASVKICGDCHTSKLDGAAFQAGYEARLEDLARAMSTSLLAKIGNQVTVKDYTPHSYGGKEYDVKSDAIAIDKTNIVSIEPTEPHGQQGYLFNLKSAVNVSYTPSGEQSHSMSVTKLEVQLGDITTDGKTALVPLTDPLVKAGWNYFLIHGDASLGVHNPAFTMDALNAAIAALK